MSTFWFDFHYGNQIDFDLNDKKNDLTLHLNITGSSMVSRMVHQKETDLKPLLSENINIC